ncbi:MAG: PKD domain-containing protein, partial [Bacteroidia bacterium]
FAFNKSCLGNPTNFIDQSSVTFGTISSWNWNFGDGKGTSTQQNPTYTYSVVGTYLVKLIVSSTAGCIDSIIQTVVVNPVPVADFTANTVCRGTSTVFTNASTGANAWSWSFGDGGTSIVQNPVYNYAACGIYNVVLTVVSDSGCSHDTSITVQVKSVPYPNFITTNVCYGFTSSFTNQSTIGCRGRFAGWSWNFGDGSPLSSAQDTTHTYAAPGVYNVTLTVSSSDGCDSAIILPDTVYPLPIPAFKTNTSCLGSPASFTDQSTVTFGTITSWNWNFGDGSPSSPVQNPSHTYTASGIYNVTLTVASDNGCDSSITLPDTVFPVPTSAFISDTVCFGDSTQFTNKSSVIGGTIASWNWNFGDGTGTSTQKNPFYKYNSAGIYTVTLVTSVAGSSCTDTIKHVVKVNALPVDSIEGIYSVCFGTSTILTARGNGIISYSWSTIPAQTNQSVTVEPTVNTVYSLTVSNGKCTAVDTFLIKVASKPSVTIKGSNLVCQGDSVTLTANSSTGNYLWNNGSTTDSIVVTINKDSTYYVVTTNGCTDTAFDTINVIPVKNVGACCDTAIEPGGVAQLTASGAIKYTWTPATNIECAICPNTTATPTVSTTYTVMGTDSNGCHSYETIIVDVGCSTSYIVPNVFTPNGDGINDNFLIKAYGYASYSIEIYDRWGVLIYQTNTPYAPWDGRNMSGNDMPDGVYYYIIKSLCGSTEVDHHGFVQLIR